MAQLGCQTAIDTHSTLPTSVTMHALDAAATVWLDDVSQISDSLRAVITHESEWNKMWTRAEGSRGESVSMPDVDFGRFYLLVVAAGTVDLGDWARVEAIGMHESILHASVVSTRGCAPFISDGTPLHIVRVPHFDGQVVFLESKAGPDKCT